MKIRFHTDAVLEFDAAVAYYEEYQRGLSLEFAEGFTLRLCASSTIQMHFLLCPQTLVGAL